MVTLAIVTGVALLVVVVTRGSFSQLYRLPIQSIWMVVVALAIQIVLAFVDIPADRLDDLGFALVMASYAFLLAFCFVNLRVPMMWIIALGIALNALVIGLNRGMPTAPNEVTTRSGRTVAEPIERTAKHRPESDDDVLQFLGDRLRVPEPVDELVSIGDVVIGVGIVLVCYQGSRVRRRPRTRAERMARISERLRAREREQKPAPAQTFTTPTVATEHALEHDPKDDAIGVEPEEVYARLAADEHAEAAATPDEDERREV
ncbi:MAG TPA: DUF5317 domain-containing protein [Acidimicrobiia bacterium]|nr:DUF5317 domain-containing protein [Acidimicrobiia bacterium]